ncbi:putative mismatch repair protein MSH3 [Leptomonas pyrrhocoris]|uniref:Putative mismatch repair protein MSH3 n=1 Tax=Leptomonas pyrrhocoris TaxID=157538 RepID=A0A0N1J4C0_LEPPY|nr:putative mismatch repair protein MSH3 [Leptomonas pyrrhocoris]XP_015653483.1 putative mismatch repair protein MSH3 [Leptomonas pyrrhocoris]KPA75043.1 putative mismatch repair protein MSH3 [Leptomonas pyrrhocoris]KPA75044.1 putative mismatch repair protein MSH3 [Leptomonas pyrrhocoris]|eukprot:XP_015653482.1 putative mismatch repair protein MSH3 [Leptomonas pyrrhocoris]
MSKRGRQDDADSVAHAIEVLCCRTPANGETEGLSLTPLERQVVALKESIAPHVILLVACGYRVKFYGCDSRAVSRRVGIMCIPGQPFEYSSVPYTRVDLYVHRLVAMGYQVGFADQESAAMRAADGLKSGLFTRTVSQLYSRGTLLPTEHVVTNGGGDSTAAAGAASPVVFENGDNDAAGDEEGGEAEETSWAGPNPRRHPSSNGAVDASELFLCFLSAQSVDGRAEVEGVDEDATAPTRWPPLEMILVSFVTQRRLHLTVRTALEMEDVTQRFDIAEVVVLTAQTPPPLESKGGGAAHLQRTTARFLKALPEVYSVALHHALPLHFGPTINGEEDDRTVTVSGFVYRRGQDVDSAVEAYLKPFKLDQVYRLLCSRTHADRQSDSIQSDLDASPMQSTQHLSFEEDARTLHLPGPTLRALDIFHSSVGSRGSLLGLLDRSLTACGARCLRRWLAAPLSSRTAIQARQAATVFLMKGSDGGLVEELLKECARLGDVEAVVGKLHAERCHVVEFVRLLRMVRGVAALAHQLCADGQDIGGDDGVADAVSDAVPPVFIRSLLSLVYGPAVAQLLEANTALLKTTATTPLEFFTEGGRAVPAALQIHWDAKRAAEAALEAELKAAREVLHLPGLEYRTIAGTSYLLDVPQGKCGRVPADWLVQTRTKTHVRYHTPAIVEQHIARTAATERLVLAAAAAWRQHQREVVADANVMEALHGVVAAVGSLDALHSLAVASRQPGYVMPQLVDLPEVAASNVLATAARKVDTSAAVSLSISDGRHPVLDQLLPHGYVSCSVELRAGGAWLLTGPNMGGKSALMRMVGSFVVLAQIGCGVPAGAAVMPVFHGVYCRMGASDSILEGSSTFLSEMEETSRILRAADLPRSIVLMDELGRGTSSFDGAAVAAATLEYLLANRATTIFVTHYSYLCDPYVSAEERAGSPAPDGATTGVSCYFMGFVETAGQPGAANTKQLVFTYKPCRGVTPSSFGVAIGRKAGLPAAVTAAASEVSAEVEKEHRMKQDLHQLRRLAHSTGV